MTDFDKTRQTLIDFFDNIKKVAATYRTEHLDTERMVDFYLKEHYFSNIQKCINETPDNLKGKYSDGYHTFEELYEFRKAYNAALFNEWAKEWYIRDKQIKEGRMVPSNVVFAEYDVHKSWNHHDGEPCFGGDWFIVVAVLPTGQISNHYHKKDWGLFNVPEVAKAKHPFDGHTSQDVINRLFDLGKIKQ